jgi:adenylylsulfate kinase
VTEGAVVWLTGLPASGKSLLAERARARLGEKGIAALVLDSDSLRRALVPTPGYSAAERNDFYSTLSNLAAMLANQGLVVLVAATAPRHEHRALARGLVAKFIEVYLATSLDECASRDPKGLYANARRNPSMTLPGVGAAYESPESPDVVANGGLDDAALNQIVALVA